MILVNIQVCLGRYRRCATSNLVWQRRNTIEYLLQTSSSCLAKVETPTRRWGYQLDSHPSAFPWDEDKALRTTGRKTFVEAPNLYVLPVHSESKMKTMVRPMWDRAPTQWYLLVVSLPHEVWEGALVVEKEKGVGRKGDGWERKSHGCGFSFLSWNVERYLRFGN